MKAYGKLGKCLAVIVACLLAFSCQLAELGGETSGSDRSGGETSGLLSLRDDDVSGYERIVGKSDTVPVMLLLVRNGDDDSNATGVLADMAKEADYSGLAFYKVVMPEQNENALLASKSSGSVAAKALQAAKLSESADTPLLLMFRNGEVKDTKSREAITAAAVKELVDNYCEDCVKPAPASNQGVVELASADEFTRKILNCSNCIAVVDFYKDACIKCTSIASSMEELSRDSSMSNVAFYKAHAWDEQGRPYNEDFDGFAEDASSVILPEYNIYVTPNVIVYVDGKAKCGFTGNKSTSDFKSFILNCVENGCAGDSCSAPSSDKSDDSGNQGGSGLDDQSSSGAVLKLTSDADYEKFVKNSSGYVFVDYYKGWCVNCLWVGWAFKKLSAENYKGVKFCEAQSYGTSIVKNGNEDEWNEYYGRWVDKYSSRGDEFVAHVKDFLDNGSSKDDYICYSKSYSDLNGLDITGNQNTNYTPTIILYKDGVPLAALGATDADGYCWSVSGVKDFIDKYVK